jgi:hypothetical protein
VALVPYQPFQGGLLTGKYRSGVAPPQASRAAEKAAWLAIPDAATFEKLEELRRLADEACMSMAQYAVAWVLARPGVTAVVTGCRSLEQLEPLIAAAGTPIPGAHTARLDELFPPPKPAGEQVLAERRQVAAGGSRTGRRMTWQPKTVPGNSRKCIDPGGARRIRPMTWAGSRRTTGPGARPDTNPCISLPANNSWTAS